MATTLPANNVASTVFEKKSVQVGPGRMGLNRRLTINKVELSVAMVLDQANGLDSKKLFSEFVSKMHEVVETHLQLKTSPKANLRQFLQHRLLYGYDVPGTIILLQVNYIVQYKSAVRFGGSIYSRPDAPVYTDTHTSSGWNRTVVE